MTFLSPTMLWGLVAAAAPLLIHLFSQRNTREVEFSSLAFLKEMEHDSLRRIQWKQWLLILLRTLMIVFLVLAFSRPVRHGILPTWVGGTQENHIVCLVDNSASMAAVQGETSFLDICRKMIPDILSSVKGQSTVSIYQTTPFRRLYQGEADPGKINARLDNILPSGGEDHLWSAVDSIVQREHPREPNREMFLLSDIPVAPPADWQPDSAWRYYLTHFAPVEDNLSLVSGETKSSVRLPNSLLKLSTQVRNSGTIEKKNVPVELFLDDQRVGQVVVTLSPQTEKNYVFQAFPGESGIVKGRLELPKDDFSLDNRYTLEIPIPVQIACQAISRNAEDGFFLNLALSSIDQQGDFLVLTTDYSPVPEEVKWQENDILIFHNPDFLPDNIVKEMDSFLAEGGSILLFYGDALGQALTPRARRELGLPRTLGWREAGEGNYFSLEAHSAHPILADLRLRNLKGELPLVSRYERLQAAGEDEVILRFTNGDPYLIRHPHGKGSLFLFASPVELQSTDLPMKGLLVPLLHRILVYSAVDETNTSPIPVGATKIIHLPRELINSRWEMVTPAGNSYRLIPDFNSESLIITDTWEVGSYQILSDGAPYLSFSTHLSPGEFPDHRADPEL
ncbi:MAG: hypothetical protein D6762_06595, partial [Candidatus Neomarinimicrobiota bacterium]